MAEPRAHDRKGTALTVFVVLTLIVLVWGADVLARLGAERLVARDVQSATGADEPPKVTIDGRLFLLEVVRGRYERVHVTARGLRSGPLVIDELDAELTDVRVPFHDVLVQDVRAVGVGRSTETVRLTYPAVNAYLEATGRPFRVAHEPGSPAVTASGTVDVLDQRVTVTADVALSVSGGTLRLTPRDVQTGGGALSDLATLLLNQRLTVALPLQDLPFSQRLTAVDVGDDGLVVHAAGEAVVLRP